MKYEHVNIEAITHILPEEIVTSEEIEERLAPVYDRLRLPTGRLELMTGIRERRFFPPGTKPGAVSERTAVQAVEKAGLPRELYGALIHGSVCRDQMEPATANRVHHAAELPANCLVLDLSNACLGILNGVQIIAGMIERGEIEAGIAVGTETGRGLVEGTIESLLHDDTLTRKSIKSAIASLTIGSGSAAIVLCRRERSRSGLRLVGGMSRADTSAHHLCAGGTEAEFSGDARPRMQTDSEALLHAGIGLAGETWPMFLEDLGWSATDVDRVITHQVGKAHRKAMLETIGIPEERDFPTVEFLGNIGSAALPVTTSLALDEGVLKPNQKITLLGIGSGLSTLMLALEYGENS